MNTKHLTHHCPHCGLEIQQPPEPLRCANCRAVISDDWLFCAECGCTLHDDQPVKEKMYRYPTVATIPTEVDMQLCKTAGRLGVPLGEIVANLVSKAPGQLTEQPVGKVRRSINLTVGQHKHVGRLAADAGMSARGYLRSILVWAHQEGLL